MRKTLLALSIPFLLCVLAHAASFDCTKAKTAQEKAICGTPALSAADDQIQGVAGRGAAGLGCRHSREPDRLAAISRRELPRSRRQ